MTSPRERYLMLCGVDGSPASDRALELLARLPVRPHDEVVVTSYPPYLFAARADGAGIAPALAAAAERRARSYVDSAVARLQSAHVRVRGTICDGESATDALLRVAERERPHLIVVGSRGRAPWMTVLLGSTARALVIDSPAPVLVVRAPSVPRTVIVATDGSGPARAAIDAFVHLPQAEGAHIELLHVLPSRDDDPSIFDEELLSLRESNDRAQEDHGRELLAQGRSLLTCGLESRVHLERGHAGERIVARAREIGADLVVLGTRGLDGPRRLIWGSTAEHVVTRAACNVLVAPMPRVG